jgi:hypothetical protein
MTTELARRNDVLPDASTWKTMLEMAGTLVQSGMLPATIKTPAAALAIMQKGRELGIPPMYALSNISIINGKPVSGSELMLAMVYRDHGDGAIHFEQTDDERCVVLYKRRSWTQPRRHAFTYEEADRAGLLSKGGPWKQYPAAMLRARCISAVARLAFPDTLGGMYTPEEMGADVEVNEQGEVVTVEQAEPERIQCQNCEKAIGPARVAGGQVLTPAEVAARGLERFGAELCASCARHAVSTAGEGADDGD